MIAPQISMGTLLSHTALTLVNTAVARSTLRSIKIGWVNAVMKSIANVKPAPTIVPSAKNGNKFSKSFSI